MLRTLVGRPRPARETAATALYDLAAAAAARPALGRAGSGADGDLAVVQLFLHADIDGELSHAGRGDTGGIATLLVHLGDALVTGDGGVTRR